MTDYYLSDNIMLFPAELWNNIFSYFHSTFKTPNHYIIMNDVLNYNPQIGWARVRNLHDNFYLYFLFNTIMWNKRKKYSTLFLLKYQANLLSFKRINYICSPKIYTDFNNIRKSLLNQYSSVSGLIKEYISN